jgi:hypothetical protein
MHWRELDYRIVWSHQPVEAIGLSQCADRAVALTDPWNQLKVFPQYGEVLVWIQSKDSLFI